MRLRWLPETDRHAQIIRLALKRWIIDRREAKRKKKGGTQMRIQITLHNCHPHFGGHETTVWRFAMSDGLSAQAKYIDLKKEIGTSGYAFVEIGVVLIGDDVDREKGTT